MDSEEMDSKRALHAILNITEEIPSGFGLDDIHYLFSNSDELLDNLRQSVRNKLKTDVEDFWEDNNLDEKLQRIKKLQNETSHSSAWRPKTGEVNINSIEKTRLEMKKSKLLAMIESYKKKSSELSEYLTKEKELLKVQMENVDLFQNINSNNTSDE